MLKEASQYHSHTLSYISTTALEYVNDILFDYRNYNHVLIILTIFLPYHR